MELRNEDIENRYYNILSAQKKKREIKAVKEITMQFSITFYQPVFKLSQHKEPLFIVDTGDYNVTSFTGGC